MSEQAIKGSKSGPEVTLWLLGLIPFLLVAMKILFVSRGDPAVFPYLLQQLDVVALVLATILPLLSICLVWIWIMWYDKRRLRPKDQRSDLGTWPMVIFPIFLFCIFASPVVTLISSGVVLAYTVASRLRIPSQNRALLKRYGADYPALWRPIPLNAVSFLAIICVQSLLTVNASWLPSEEISVKDQAPETARVISVNEVFITYLNRNEVVSIVRSEDVISRQPCSVTTRSVNDSLFRYILAILKPDEQKICPRGD